MRQEAGVVEKETEAEEYTPDDGLVACPICSWRMKPEKVDRHLDTDCPGEPRPQPQPSESKPRNLGFPSVRSAVNISTKPQERLSELNYSLVKDTALRKRLSEMGISNGGSRHLLEKRHKEWVMIWNANCDSARPKAKSELLRDLEIWERTQGGSAPANSHSANLGAQIKDKEFDGLGWSAKHSDSFKDLIANARMTRQKANETTRESSHEARDQSLPVSNKTFEQPPHAVSNARGLSEDHAIQSSDTLMNEIPTSSQPIAHWSPRIIPEDRAVGPLSENRPLPSEMDTISSSENARTMAP
ncbi:E3 ubiquitin-protein ligase rad18 [Diaporthe australafricana]|uniref:Postreplication repair E3 ubiquitin-protein ligase RAD18 n=1 Tax=Diaporthe australafricana TaxID=127596 RepID=A0ABR3X279_9PEZI